MNRNFKLLLRNKAQASIIFLAPLLILFIIGLAFSTQTDQRISVGYYTPDANEFSTEFVNLLKDSNYTIKEYSAYDLCKNAIGVGEIHLCVAFPSEFELGNNKQNHVEFLIDNSKVNFFSTVADQINQDFNLKARELSSGLTSEILSKLNQTSSEISDKGELIAKLKVENAEMAAAIKTAETSLSSSSVSFDKDTLGLNKLDIESVTEELDELVGSTITDTEKYLEDLEDFRDDVDSKLNNSDIEDLDEIINKTTEKLQALKKERSSSTNSTKKEFSDRLDDLDSDLQDLENKLSFASGKQSDVKARLLELKTKNAQNLAKIESIESTFAAITSNIGQTEITDLDVIVNPITYKVEPVVTDESSLNFYFPYLIILIICFIGLLLASSLVIMDKLSTAYFRNFVTPTHDTTFLIGIFLTSFTIVAIQVTLLVSIYHFYFGRDVLVNLPTTAIILGFAVSIFILIGMVLGNLFNSEASNMLSVISLSSIMIFISDLVFPLERMPEQVAMLNTMYNPFYICSDALRKAMVHNVDFYVLLDQLLILGLYVITLSAILVATYKLNKRHFLLRFSGYFSRREVKKMTEQANYNAIFDKMVNLSEEEYFTTVDNQKIKDLGQLLQYIASLDKRAFKYYVNKDRNLFADWVGQKINHDSLAMKLYHTHNQSKMTKLIKKDLAMLLAAHKAPLKKR